MNILYLLSKMKKAQLGGPDDKNAPIEILPKHIVYEITKG